jgi:hypothetical protein
MPSASAAATAAATAATAGFGRGRVGLAVHGRLCGRESGISPLEAANNAVAVTVAAGTGARRLLPATAFVVVAVVAPPSGRVVVED